MEPQYLDHSIFNLDLIYQPNTGVICRTYNQFYALCELGHTHDLKWDNGESFITNPKEYYIKNIIFFMPDGIAISSIKYLNYQDTALEFDKIINKENLHDRCVRNLLRVLSTGQALSFLSQFAQVPGITDTIIDDFTSNLLSNWEL